MHFGGRRGILSNEYAEVAMPKLKYCQTGLTLEAWPLRQSPTRQRFHHLVKATVIEGASSVLILLVSLRIYLFSGGYYEYSDQRWPLIAAIYPSGDFSPTVINQGWINIFQFTRDVISWPYLVFNSVIPGQSGVEKAFIVYGFLLVIISSFIASEFVVRLCERVYRFSVESMVMREGTKVCIVLLIFTNPWVSQVIVDGGAWTDSIVFMGFLIVLVRFITSPLSLRWVLVCAGITSVSLLLDPVWYPLMIISIGAIVVFQTLIGNAGRKYFVSFVWYIAGTLPALIYIESAINLVGAPSSGSLSGAIFRGIATNSSAWSFQNMSVLTALLTIGYPWSTYTFASPNIMSHASSVASVSSLGSPTLILLPPGILSNLWITSLFALPIASYISLLLLPREKVTVALALVALLALTLGFYPLFPPAVAVLESLANLPYVGNSISQVFSLPSRFFFIADAAYILLASLTFFGLLFSRQQGANSFRPTHRPSVYEILLSGKPSQQQISRTRTFVRRLSAVGRFILGPIVAIVLVVAVVFAGWQSLNGDYFPSRFESFGSGNGVPDSAPYRGQSPGPGVQEVYDYVYRYSNGSDLYWPSGGAYTNDYLDGVAFFDANDAPAPEIMPAALPSLISQQDLGLIAPYLASLSLKFIVIQELPGQILQSEFGVSNFSELERTMDSVPGLTKTVAFPNLALYTVKETSGEFRPVDAVIPSSGLGLDYVYAVAGLDSAGLPTTAVSSENGQLGLDTTTKRYDVLSPEFLMASGLPNTFNSTQNFSFYGQPVWTAADSFRYTLNKQVNWTSDNASVAFMNNTREILYAGNHVFGSWDVAAWTPTPVYIDAGGGQLNVTFDGSSTVTLSYNGTVAGVSGGVCISSPLSHLLLLRQNSTYRTSSDFNGSITVLAADMQSVSTQGTSNSFSYPSGPYKYIANSATWKGMSYATVPPLGVKCATVRIEIQGVSGTVDLKDIDLSYASVSVGSFSGYESTSLPPNRDNYVGQWSLTNWGPGDVNLTGGNGVAGLVFHSLTTASVSYNGSMAGFPGGFEIHNPDSKIAVVNQSFEYETSPDFNGNVSIYLVGGQKVNTSASAQSSYGWYSEPPIELAPSNTWKKENYTALSKNGTQYVNVRVAITADRGTVTFKDLTFSIGVGCSSKLAPFGLDIGGDNLNISLRSIPNETLLLNYDGVGSVNGHNLTRTAASVFNWYSFGGASTFNIRGNMTIREALLLPSVVWLSSHFVGVMVDRPYLPTYLLESGGQRYVPVATEDDEMYFAGTTLVNLRLVFGPQEVLSLGYVAIVSWIALLFFSSQASRRLLKQRWPRRRIYSILRR